MKNAYKIVVIGVKYDSNLGDMLLGDCLCHLLSKEIPYATIDYLDMRGRVDVDKYENKKSNGLYSKIRHWVEELLDSVYLTTLFAMNHY